MALFQGVWVARLLTADCLTCCPLFKTRTFYKFSSGLHCVMTLPGMHLVEQGALGTAADLEGRAEVETVQECY